MNNNENNKIQATTQWMAAMYDKMNSELFNGRLGGCSFNIFTTGRGSQGGTLGRFKLTGNGLKVERYTRRIYFYSPVSYNKVYIDSKNFTTYCKPQIELNGNYTASEEGFLATLVHEMCHYYTYMNGFAPKQGHGPEFYSIGRAVCAKSNNRFNIQRLATAEEMKEWKLNDEMQAKKDKRIENKKKNITAIILYNNNGTVELSTTSSQSVINDILRRARERYTSTRGTCQKVISSKDPELIELLFEKGYKKNFRTYRYWNVEQQPWLDQVENFDYTVLYNKTMKESKHNNTIENVIKHFLQEEFGINDDDNDIVISPNMDLGKQSPLECN